MSWSNITKNGLIVEETRNKLSEQQKIINKQEALRLRRKRFFIQLYNIEKYINLFITNINLRPVEGKDYLESNLIDICELEAELAVGMPSVLIDMIWSYDESDVCRARYDALMMMEKRDSTKIEFVTDPEMNNRLMGITINGQPYGIWTLWRRCGYFYTNDRFCGHNDKEGDCCIRPFLHIIYSDNKKDSVQYILYKFTDDIWMLPDDPNIRYSELITVSCVHVGYMTEKNRSDILFDTSRRVDGTITSIKYIKKTIVDKIFNKSIWSTLDFDSLLKDNKKIFITQEEMDKCKKNPFVEFR